MFGKKLNKGENLMVKFSIDYYKKILKEMFEAHSLYHCLGYIQCMSTHEIVSNKEALSLIDFVDNLREEKSNDKH